MMQRLFCNWLLMGCLVALAGVAVGCGMPQSAEDTVLAEKQQALSQLESLSQSTFQRAEVHPLLQWKSAYESLSSAAQPVQHATSQGVMQTTSLRYLTFQVDWRGERYQISSDLQAIQFSLSIQRITRPLKLQCVPGNRAQAKKVVIQVPDIGTVGPTSPQKSESEMVRFERDAKTLAQQVWTPMYQLWKLGRCSTQKRCNSEIFSDITLDFQAEPQFNCQMKIVVTKQPKP